VRLREAWETSKYPYVELTYRAAQLSGASATTATGAKDPKAQVKAVIKNAKISKIVFTIFLCIGMVIPFAEFGINHSPISLVGAVTLSLLISFAYLMLYSLQILPSFAGAEPYSLLLTLPLTTRDFSTVTLLSFVRTFDYLAIGSILVPVVTTGILTGSAAASVVMLGASIVNVIFAVMVGLWFSSLFYRNITRGGRSRGAMISRTLFLISWGFAAMSTGFVYQLATYTLPYVNQLISGNLSQAGGALIAALHPFTFGVAIASLAFPKFLPISYPISNTALFALVSYVAAACYVGLAYVAVRRTTRTISNITHGLGPSIIRVAAKEFTLKLRRPLSAYLMKDIRIASKNPSMAFLFALPVFETVIIAMSISGARMVGILDVASMTMMGSLFTLLASSMLLNTERTGLDYTMSLPLGPSVIINAKSLISTLIYLPVPVVVLLIELIKGGTVGISALFPFVEILAISAATTAEVAVFITARSGSTGVMKGSKSLAPAGFNIMSGENLGRTFKAIAIALFIVAAPVAFFFGLAAYGEITSILAMTLVAMAELIIVQVIVRLTR